MLNSHITQSSLSLLAGAASFVYYSGWMCYHLFIHWGAQAPSSAQWSTTECIFSHYMIRLVRIIHSLPPLWLIVCLSPSLLFLSILFEAGVSADVRYSHHPAAAAKTADTWTSSIQHCDCQSRLSQTCREGSASGSDCKPFLQPNRNSSKEVLEGWDFFFPHTIS